ncbi:4Fe-4S binding protein, partial [Acidobacteriota bacterium]
RQPSVHIAMGHRYELVGEDGAAVDAAMVRAIGFDPRQVPHLAAVESKGLGVIAAQEIEIDGEMPEVDDFTLPATYRTSSFLTTLFNSQIFRLLSKPKVKIDKNKCTACAVCEESCPTGAISVKGDCARVENAECAACYLCHEICPESSVKISGILGWVTRRAG